MNIHTHDYKGNDRRNGGKLKLSTADWVKVFCIVCSLSIGGITWYNKVNFAVADVVKNCEANTTLNECQEKEITILETNLANLTTKVDDIYCIQKDNTKLLHEILGKLK
jgi:hypothetical protein